MKISFLNQSSCLRTTKYYISSEFLLKEGFVLDALRKEVVYYFFRRALSKNFLLTHSINILNNCHIKLLIRHCTRPYRTGLAKTNRKSKVPGSSPAATYDQR